MEYECWDKSLYEKLSVGDLLIFKPSYQWYKLIGHGGDGGFDLYLNSTVEGEIVRLHKELNLVEVSVKIFEGSNGCLVKHLFVENNMILRVCFSPGRSLISEYANPYKRKR